MGEMMRTPSFPRPLPTRALPLPTRAPQTILCHRYLRRRRLLEPRNCLSRSLHQPSRPRALRLRSFICAVVVTASAAVVASETVAAPRVTSVAACAVSAHDVHRALVGARETSARKPCTHSSGCSVHRSRDFFVGLACPCLRSCRRNVYIVSGHTLDATAVSHLCADSGADVRAAVNELEVRCNGAG